MVEPAAPSRHAVLERWLPGLAQLASYPRGALRGDLIGGLSVCVVMIPSVLAYAELAGVRAEAGLYAALGSMIVFALFTSTRRVIVGPDTTIALLAGSVIAPLAVGDPGRAAALAAALALMTGVILVVAGRVGLGDIADLLSTPVLVGYAAGAALILIGTQLPVLLGLALPRDAFFLRLYDALIASAASQSVHARARRGPGRGHPRTRARCTACARRARGVCDRHCRIARAPSRRRAASCTSHRSLAPCPRPRFRASGCAICKRLHPARLPSRSSCSRKAS